MTTYRFGKNLLLGCAMGTALFGPLVASGQANVSQATAQTAAPPGIETLETVVVTAQRRAERLQDVPITITNLSAEALTQANVEQLGDIQQVTPGFNLENHSGIFQPSIRGISTTITCVVCGSSVGMYVDGFFVPHPVSLDFQLQNVESIQVLKGPQGTLFGRNTVGGAVEVNTAKPSTDTSAVVEVAYGSYNAQTYQVYATTGLGEKVAVDFAGSYRTGNGWVTNIADGDNKYGQYFDGSFRVGLKADVTDDLSFILRYQHIGLNDPTGILAVPYLYNGQPLAYGAHLPGAIVADEPREVSAPYRETDKTQSDTFQLTGILNLGFGTLTSYTQNRQDNTAPWNQSYDFTNLNLLWLNIPDEQRTFTQEFLLTSKPGSRFQWTTGLFYFDSKESYHNITEVLFGGPSALLSTTMSDDRSIAAYADVTYEPVDNLFLTAGLRYNHDFIVDAGWILPGTGPGTGETLLPNLVGNKVTPRAVIRYALNPESNVYASYSEGYKAAIYSTGGYSSTPVQPEDMKAFEVGYKYAVKNLSADVSAFYYDYTNEQLTSEIILNGSLASSIRNAASSHVYGVDADLRYDVSSAFEVNVAAEYLHATYQSFPDAPAFTILPNYLLPSTSINASGYQMAVSPPVTLNVGGTYTAPVAAGKLALSANVYYTAKFYFDFAEQQPQNAYALLRLRAQWTDASGRYEFAIAGNNVTNTKYYVGGNESEFGEGGVWGAPATVEGSVRVKFH